MKRILVVAFSFLLVLTLVACTDSKPIKIGFVGSLTGGFSDIGVPARNAVQLKIEEINQAGGIDGRKIKLIIKDSKGEQEKALKAVKELNETGVDAIIGPSLSSNALHILPYINNNKILTIGTTITSRKLSKQDDYFFRVSQTNEPESILQAKFLIENGQQELAAVLDLNNQGYTKPWYDLFKTKYEAAGGTIKHEWKYSDGESINHSRLAEKIVEAEPEALVTVTSAMSTAMIAQQLERHDYDPFFITSGWAKTDELIRQGGRTVEGIYTSHAYDTRNKPEALLAFEADYEDRFKRQPNFAAEYAYDAAGVLFEALENVDAITAQNIKRSLLELEKFAGVQDEFGFDKFGDVDRSYLMYQVVDGQFKVVED